MTGHLNRTSRVRKLRDCRLAFSQVAVKFMERTQEKITKNIEREILNHSSLVRLAVAPLTNRLV